ncbi:MAG: DUF4907 domain-containing protein [Bacteroidota bacterium]
MKSKTAIVIAIVLIIVMAGISVNILNPSSDNSRPETIKRHLYGLKVLQEGQDTWSYEIYLDDHLYIKQTWIPGISGKQKFASEVDARTIGDLMVQKLDNGDIPSISKQELDENRITYKK